MKILNFKTAAVAGLMAVAGAAHAQAPIVSSGVGVRLTENFNRFLESQLTNKDLAFTKPNIFKQNISCFDEVGINNLAVSTHLDNAALDFKASDSGLSIIVNMANLDIAGDLYGIGASGFNLCPDFQVGITDIKMTNVTVTMDIAPRADGAYNVYIAFNAPPQIDVGDLHVAIDGFPQFLVDLVTRPDFIQDFLFDQINKQIATQVPNMVKDPLIQGMFTGQLAGFQYGIGATNIAIDDNGASALFDTQFSYMGPRPSCVPTTSTVPNFATRGTPGLGEYGDVSQIEMSIADSAVNEVLWGAWASGLMCYNSEDKPLAAFQHVLEGISPDAGSMLHYDLKIGQPPELAFNADKMAVSIKKFHLEADEVLPDGTSKILLLADADLSMALKVDLDVATNRVLATMDSMDLTFDNLSSQILFSDRPEAEQDLKDFIKGYIVPRMVSQVQNMPVTNAVMPVSGFYVIVDELKGREGHAVAGISIYANNDPAIDTVAPNTFVDSNPGTIKATHGTFAYHGSDDRAGKLLYSWRIDGMPWSAYNEAVSADVTALTDGSHTFEVKARDRFQNEDPSPASLTFQVAAETPTDTFHGSAFFGCDVTSSAAGTIPAGAIAALAGALAVGVLIRRRQQA